MYKYKCLNPIAKFGLDHFTREYVQVELCNWIQAFVFIHGLSFSPQIFS